MAECPNWQNMHVDADEKKTRNVLLTKHVLIYLNRLDSLHSAAQRGHKSLFTAYLLYFGWILEPTLAQSYP